MIVPLSSTSTKNPASPTSDNPKVDSPIEGISGVMAMVGAQPLVGVFPVQ